MSRLVDSSIRAMLVATLASGLVACAALRGDHGTSLSAADSARLAEVLARQPAETRARYPYRHPRATLEFFGVAPGMTVVEVLPGGGWYSRLLAPYLGPEGVLIGANYAHEMAAMFAYMTPERLAERQGWERRWPKEAAEWAGPGGARTEAFLLGSMPAEFEGRADVVLFIRALHNLYRFESQGGFLTEALRDAHRALAPGGILGVVQHHARDEMPDSWADGSAGYLKKADLIARAEAAGFEYVGESEVNANPLDRPTTDDIVWRLPPSLSTSKQDAASKARLEAVGESNRMTLKFRKPGA